MCNIAKVYLITCGQSTCSKLKKHEFCRNFNVEMPIYIILLLKDKYNLRLTFNNFPYCNNVLEFLDLNSRFVNRILTTDVYIIKTQMDDGHWTYM